MNSLSTSYMAGDGVIRPYTTILSNGIITNSMIDASAGINISKLAPSGVSND